MLTRFRSPASLVAAALAGAMLPLIGCDRPASNPSPVGDATASATAATKPTTRGSDDRDDPRLIGTWIARDVDAKVGEVKIKLTFRKDGDMKLAAWSDIPFAGQVRDKQGAYTVGDGTLSSPAIRDGVTVDYRFDGDALVIQYKEGKTVRFTRQ